MDPLWILLVVVVVGLLALILKPVLQRRGAADPAPPAEADEVIPPGLTIRPQPLLTDVEALFYNLLRLTVQDQYLLFAQVPLWCLVEIAGADRKARAALLGRIALKRVDFVLVHPGTLALAKVIELDDQAKMSDKKQGRDRLLDALFTAADIELVRLDANGRYTVPQLAALLAVEPTE
jgi:hypothetical protein